MSSPSDMDAILFSFFQYNCCTYAVATLLVFSWITSLDQEVRLFWSVKYNAATVLFVCNQYGQMLAVLLNAYSPTTVKTCEIIFRISAVLTAVSFLCNAVFSSWRIFALARGQWVLLVVVTSLGLVPVVTNLYHDSLSHALEILKPSALFTECIISDAFSPRTDMIFGITTRACVVLADAIVLGTTWMQTYQVRQAAKQANIKSKLADLLMRDGTGYFLSLLVLNTLQMVFDFPQINMLGGSSNFKSFVSSINQPLTSILISKYFLNLKSFANHDDITGTSDLSLNSDIEFAGNRNPHRTHALVVGLTSHNTGTYDEGSSSVAYTTHKQPGHSSSYCLDEKQKNDDDSLIFAQHEYVVGDELIYKSEFYE